MKNSISLTHKVVGVGRGGKRIAIYMTTAAAKMWKETGTITEHHRRECEKTNDETPIMGKCPTWADLDDCVGKKLKRLA